MSATIHSTTKDISNRAFNDEQKRSYAVAVALELIAAHAASNTAVNLSTELDNLSKYADQIQAALKVK